MTIDFNSPADLRASATEGVLAAIEAGLTARPHHARRYLGASSLGHPCGRKVQLDHVRALDLPHAPEPKGGGRIEPTTQRIFDMGHALEELAARWLREAGFKLVTQRREGGQIGFMVADGRFGGHCDGVLVEGPDAMTYPALWEHKAVGRRSWQEIAKKGVAVARPVYAAQVALYQCYLDLPNPALFMATNRDSGELYLELVPFDGGLAQTVSDLAVRILQATDAGDLLPKSFASADHPDCKMCSWSGFCHG